MPEATLLRWLAAVREGVDREEALDIARKLARLGPHAQEAAAAAVARLARTERERRRILEDVEAWSRRHDRSGLVHFLGALRDRIGGPRPGEPEPPPDEETTG